MTTSLHPETPFLCLDWERFMANLELMRERVAAAGKLLRPHAKTHKCSRISRQQLETGRCAGVCAAKISEAMALAAAGIPDILLTSPVVGPGKIGQWLECQKVARNALCVIDSLENAAALNAAAGAAGCRLPYLLDLDPEMGRTGVPFGEAEALFNLLLTLPNLLCQGVQCYAGQLQHLEAPRRNAESRRLMTRATEIYRNLQQMAGVPLPVFTGTGTGTAMADLELSDLTDLQVGSYCLMDSEYLAVDQPQAEHFAGFRPAITLVTSVISRNHPNQVTVDAGLKALYYTPAAPPRLIRNGQFLPNWSYDWFGDEFGLVRPPAGCQLQLDSRLEVSLPHCDPTINLHDRLYLRRQGVLTECWDIDLRGKCQ